MKYIFILFFLFNYFSNILLCQTPITKVGYCLTNTFNYYDKEDAGLELMLQEQLKHTNLVRFPGGNISNYYHFQGGGYGFKKNEFPSSKYFLFKNLNSLNLISSKKEENYIYDFISFAKKYSLEVIYVANITTASVEEILKILELLSNNNIKVVAVELGNELYSEVYRNKISNVNEYIDLAKLFNNKIKYRFPNIKTGVVSAPLSTSSFFKNWNKILAKEDFYDGVIVHLYHKGEKHDYDMQADKYRSYSNELKKYLEKEMTEDLSRYNEIFKNNDLWITEWNLGVSKSFGNTILQSLFVSSFCNNIFISDFNIKYLIYHKLLSNEYTFSLINPKWKIEKDYYLNKSNYIKRSSYYFFDFLNIFLEILSKQDFDYIEKSSVLLDNNVFVFNYDLIRSSKDTIKTYSFIVNFSQNIYDVNYIINRNNVRFQSYGFFNAENFYSGHGVNGLINKKYKENQKLEYIDFNSNYDQKKIDFIQGISVYLGEILYY